MKEKIIKIIDGENDISSVKKEELKYGLNCLSSFLEKFIFLFLLALVFKTWKSFILVLAFFTPLRIFGFGYHAKSNLYCWIISLSFYFLIPTLINLIEIPGLVVYVGGVVSFLAIAVFAPASTFKKPLKNQSKNRKRKITIIFICLAYLIIIGIIKNANTKECILSALVFEALLVNPLLEKLAFKRTLLNKNDKV